MYTIHGTKYGDLIEPDFWSKENTSEETSVVTVVSCAKYTGDLPNYFT